MWSDKLNQRGIRVNLNTDKSSTELGNSKLLPSAKMTSRCMVEALKIQRIWRLAHRWIGCVLLLLFFSWLVRQTWMLYNESFEDILQKRSCDLENRCFCSTVWCLECRSQFGNFGMNSNRKHLPDRKNNEKTVRDEVSKSNSLKISRSFQR